MADQCIVCLENLDVALPLDNSAVQPATFPVPGSESATPTVQTQPKSTADNTTIDDDSKIAEIHICGHILHDSCLRDWTAKANSCPICRQTFNFVNVYDKVGGTILSSYAVEDKKQVADFDAQAWLDENPQDDVPARPCPICASSDHEDVLILCDNCDAPYHTYCVGLDSVPRGSHWFCMECNEEAALALTGELDDAEAEGYGGLLEADRSDYMPRTQANMRRARRRARSDQWQRTWRRINDQVYDALALDLDNPDDDEALRNYRVSQRHRDREEQVYQRWRQRLDIASRMGAREVFASHLPQVLEEPVQVQRQQPPPPRQETAEEKRAWGDLEKAMEANQPPNGQASSSRKRKSRSATASPREPPREPERRLKRPRTKRVAHHTEAASSSTQQNGESSSAVAVPAPTAEPSTVQGQNSGAPSFLSSLLREVEMSTPSDDETIQSLFGTSKLAVDPSSPAVSPSPSGHSSPRALSTTPPPRGSSPLSLTSHIMPIYPPANFSPNRNGSDHGDSESRSRRQHHPNGQHNGATEIRQPRPRRHQPVNITTNHVPQSPESSPTRGTLSLEAKESASNIVKAALKPHYKSGSITADQYTTINRDLSRKLYKEMTDEILSDEVRSRCEKLATKEVARAVAELKVNDIQV